MKEQRLRLFLVLEIFAALLLIAAIEYRETRPQTRVLFIGNSFTFVHDVPGLLREISIANGEAKPVTPTMLARPSFTLQKHWEGGEAQELVLNRPWDYVVLQDASWAPLDAWAELFASCASFAGLIRGHGSVPVVFATWADHKRLSDSTWILDVCSEAAFRSSSRLCPVGFAWEWAWMASPTLPLWDDDGHHASLLGAYLTASTFYVLLYGHGPKVAPDRVNECYSPATFDVIHRTAQIAVRDWEAMVMERRRLMKRNRGTE